MGMSPDQAKKMGEASKQMADMPPETMAKLALWMGRLQRFAAFLMVRITPRFPFPSPRRRRSSRRVVGASSPRGAPANKSHVVQRLWQFFFGTYFKAALTVLLVALLLGNYLGFIM